MARGHKAMSMEHASQKLTSKAPKKTTFNLDLPGNEESSDQMPLWQKLMALGFLIVACYFGYMGYLETRVNSPYDGQKVVTSAGLDIPDRYWGSYRPGVYFGMKTRDPDSVVMGLMWYFPRRLRPDGSGIRHWCEQSDNLDRYTWTEHDGKTFGVQEIEDGPFKLTTSFVKRPGGTEGGDWTARISATAADVASKGEPISILLYTALEEKSKGRIRATPSYPGKRLITGVVGETPGLGLFSVKILNNTGRVDHESYLSTSHKGLHKLTETVMTSLRLIDDKTVRGRKHIVLPGEVLPRLADGQKSPPNFIVTQVTGTLPFEVDLLFESSSFVDRPDTLTGKPFEAELNEHRDAFHAKFEDVFKLGSKGYKSEDVDFAKAAFSNLVGGIGYFYGASRVESPYTHGPVPYWKAPLYTAVPSRSFFPRGFLWDEGFHGLLISAWDVDIELDIVSHWFDLMNVEGWIPREQILGQEALSKVPEEFVTQRNTNANPPTFFLTLQFILKNHADKLVEDKGRFDTVARLFPRLQVWFDWFNSTQNGDIPGTYRWRGRDPLAARELNPKTLTSGLDDFPRSSHPNVDERHVDLRCWVGMSAGVMAELAKMLGRAGTRYADTAAYLADNLLLDELHWSLGGGAYADYGLHTDAVTLRRPPPPPPGHAPRDVREMVRVVLRDPELRFVDSAFGYVSLFPFLLHMVEPQSDKLGKVLTDMRRPELLWSPYGLRSLAKSAPMYMKRNTEHDPPYWRGYVWINVNYLAVRALKHYADTEGPHRARAAALYAELRANLVKNIARQYRRTGFVWENYSDETGEGRGSRPFAGWSSLVVLLMAEIY